MATKKLQPYLILLIMALSIFMGGNPFLEESPCAKAQQNPVRVVEFSFIPTDKAQIALWLEKEDGTFLKTLMLTEAVAYRGIGNRPGATQMNSGYRWPYGRREGVLPVWGHRRLTAEGAEPFNRVIFQNRSSEGNASRSSNDFSRDDYFCLSFTKANTRDEALDAVSCASVFTSDKGRYINAQDVDHGYSEPWENKNGEASSRPLSLTSLYPPRLDVTRCVDNGCYDHEDVGAYAVDTRQIMPELDAVTSATPPGNQEKKVLFVVPDEWEDGSYVAWLEIHVEGDYNESYNPDRYGTPQMTDDWDRWAFGYGYPYRGQPSVAFTLPFNIGGDQAETTTANAPSHYGTLHGEEGAAGEEWPPLIDETMTDDSENHPGSGADRLRKDAEGNRLKIESKICRGDENGPQRVSSFEVFPHPDRTLSHQWAKLQFEVPRSEIEIQKYEVHFSIDPMLSEEDFNQAVRARSKEAGSVDSSALSIPVGQREGTVVEAEFGEMKPEVQYYVAIRAVDTCGQTGELSTAKFMTDPVQYTTVAPCFVATAAYGSPMASEIQPLRVFRDRFLMPYSLGRYFVEVYYKAGPYAAQWLDTHTWAKPIVRFFLEPFVQLSSWLTEHDENE